MFGERRLLVGVGAAYLIAVSVVLGLYAAFQAVPGSAGFPRLFVVDGWFEDGGVVVVLLNDGNGSARVVGVEADGVVVPWSRVHVLEGEGARLSGEGLVVEPGGWARLMIDVGGDGSVYLVFWVGDGSSASIHVRRGSG